MTGNLQLLLDTCLLGCGFSQLVDVAYQGATQEEDNYQTKEHNSQNDGAKHVALMVNYGLGYNNHYCPLGIFHKRVEQY